MTTQKFYTKLLQSIESSQAYTPNPFNYPPIGQHQQFSLHYIHSPYWSLNQMIVKKREKRTGSFHVVKQSYYSWLMALRVLSLSFSSFLHHLIRESEWRTFAICSVLDRWPRLISQERKELKGMSTFHTGIIPCVWGQIMRPNNKNYVFLIPALIIFMVTNISFLIVLIPIITLYHQLLSCKNEF